MTYRAAYGKSQERCPISLCSLSRKVEPKLFRNRSTFIRAHPRPHISGGNNLIDSLSRQQVARNLLFGEFVKWHVAVERFDQVIAIRPNRAIAVRRQSACVGIARVVKPIAGPCFSEARTIQQ